MNFGLNGKFALITGGSHGIGLSAALALADEGCNVAICARSEARLNHAVELIKAKRVRVIGVPGDALIPDDIKRIVDTAISEFGTLHILINNVGGGGRWGNANIEKTDEQVWLDVYNKNALAAVRFTLKVLPCMQKQKWGRVVTVTSILGKEGGGRPWFNMAKTAQTAFMKNLSLHHEFVRNGVTFNSVAPSAIMIPDTGWEAERKKDPAAFDQMLREKYPMGRLGTPEEVASVITFVCSEQASLLNGASILVDGGETHCF